MTDFSHIYFEDRGVLAVSGDDARTFLQGLISNDVTKVTPEKTIHAALLTPQGKYLHDFFIAEGPGGRLLMDCDRDRLPDLMKRLKLYKLRAKADLADQSDQWTVAVFPGAAALPKLGLPDTAGAARIDAGGVVYTDPRLSGMGGRAILPINATEKFLAGRGAQLGSRADYDRLRIKLGVPDGIRDLVVDKSILLESGFDELNGVDWNKGCYMGQELTARTKYRGLIKKRLMPVVIEGDLPEPGAALMLDGKDAGEMRSAVAAVGGGIGLALVRLEHLEAGKPLDADGAKVTPIKPDWANF
ncbi:MAG: folate-binding protein [Rhodospirillaceae bacterium]